MRIAIFALGIIGLQLVGEVSADSSTPVLKNNPFNQPNLIATPASESADRSISIWKGLLQATLVSGENSLANVDGKLIGIGESYNGYTLLYVGEGKATFGLKGQRINLTVGDDGDHEDEQ